MNKLLFLLVILPFIMCAKPSLRNALRQQVITDFKNAIVPIISKQIQHITLPDVHTSHSGFHIDITNIRIDINAFHPNQINIILVPNSSTMRFSGTGFGMKGGAHIHVKWTIFSKSFDADVEVKDAGFDCQITMLSNGGKPNIQVNSVVVHLTNNHISIHLHGDIIVKIIEFVVDILKGHFVKEIVGQLQSKLPPLITLEVNKKLNTLPSDIEVGRDLWIKYGFPYAPSIKQDYLFTGITGFIHTKNDPRPPVYDAPDMPEFDPGNPKGIQFFFADYIIKSSIDSIFSNGFMVVSFEKKMLDHNIKMTCKASKSPELKFVDAIDVVVDSLCDVIFDGDAKNHFVLISSVHVNLKEYMKQAVLFFTINKAEFLKLDYKTDNPIDIEWFKKGVNQVLDVIKEIVNMQLGQKGIPLPTIQGIDYTDTVQFVKQGFIEICTTPIFHFTSQEDQ